MESKKLIGFNWFQFTFNWFQFTFNRFQLIPIYFQLISIYFQLISIDSNLFSIDFNLLSIDFNLFSIDFNLLSIDFNLFSIDFNLLSIDFTWFQFIFNLSQFTFNWFQFIFKLFQVPSIDFNLLSTDLSNCSNHPPWLSQQAQLQHLSCTYLINISCNCLKLYSDWVVCSFALSKAQCFSPSFWDNWSQGFLAECKKKSPEQAAEHNSGPLKQTILLWIRVAHGLPPCKIVWVMFSYWALINLNKASYILRNWAFLRISNERN